jgi:hypothetical protein
MRMKCFDGFDRELDFHYLLSVSMPWMTEIMKHGQEMP